MLKLHFLHRVGDHFCCVIVAISNKFVAIPLLFDSTKFHKILYINKIHLLPEFLQSAKCTPAGNPPYHLLHNSCIINSTGSDIRQRSSICTLQPIYKLIYQRIIRHSHIKNFAPR